jgi:hypothetical protein
MGGVISSVSEACIKLRGVITCQTDSDSLENQLISEELNKPKGDVYLSKNKLLTKTGYTTREDFFVSTVGGKGGRDSKANLNEKCSFNKINCDNFKEGGDFFSTRTTRITNKTFENENFSNNANYTPKNFNSTQNNFFK